MLTARDKRLLAVNTADMFAREIKIREHIKANKSKLFLSGNSPPAKRSKSVDLSGSSSSKSVNQSHNRSSSVSVNKNNDIPLFDIKTGLPLPGVVIPRYDALTGKKLSKSEANAKAYLDTNHPDLNKRSSSPSSNRIYNLKKIFFYIPFFINNSERQLQQIIKNQV